MPNATLTYDGKQVTFYDCDPKDCIEGWLLQGNWYELEMLEFMRSLDVKGIYVDVGAYVGTFSAFAATFTRADRVIAFEPHAPSFTKLVKNVCGLERFVWPINMALADRVGAGAMRDGGTNRGGSTLERIEKITDRNANKTTIPISTLDSMLMRLCVDVLKIDAENCEYEILLGGSRTLGSVKHLFLESWPRETCERYGVPWHGIEIVELLLNAGFMHVKEFGGDTHFWSKCHA